MNRILAPVVALSALAWLLALAPARADQSYSVLIGGSETAGHMEVADQGATRTITYAVAYHGLGMTLTSTVRLDAGLAPADLSVEGKDFFKKPVAESFRRSQAGAAWRSPADAGTTTAQGFYLPQQVVSEHLAMLARALLAAPGRRLALLPSGEASIERLAERTVSVGGAARVVGLYVIDGLDFQPVPVWLDADGGLFQESGQVATTVLRGAEAGAPDLIEAQRQALIARMRRQASGLARRPAGPLVFRHVAVFDSSRGRLLRDMTVEVRGERITALGHDARVPIAAGAEVVDGRGKTLLPGLWDMHVHLLTDYEGAMDLAAGVTSVRDLGNRMSDLMARKAAYASGALPGPRVVSAGMINSPGPVQPTMGIVVTTPEQVRAAVRTYADNGYIQLKIYDQVSPANAAIAIAEAHARGLRVSGHVPIGLTLEQAVAMGFDESQHATYWLADLLPAGASIGAHGGEIDLASPEVRRLVETLSAKQTVVDPTLAVFEVLYRSEPGKPWGWAAPVLDRLPPVIRRRALGGGLAHTPEQQRLYAASYDRMLQLLARLHRAGVPIVAGTDTTAGFAYQRELELYAAAGVANRDVLTLATLGSARIARRDNELGSIEAGKLADLVLIDGDPLRRIADIRNVAMVVKGGVIYAPEALWASVGVGPARDTRARPF